MCPRIPGFPIPNSVSFLCYYGPTYVKGCVCCDTYIREYVCCDTYVRGVCCDMYIRGVCAVIRT